MGGERLEVLLARMVEQWLDISIDASKFPIHCKLASVKLTPRVRDVLEEHTGLRIDLENTEIAELELEISLKEFVSGDFRPWSLPAVNVNPQNKPPKDRLLVAMLRQLFVCAPGVRLRMSGVTIVLDAVHEGRVLRRIVTAAAFNISRMSAEVMPFSSLFLLCSLLGGMQMMHPPAAGEDADKMDSWLPNVLTMATGVARMRLNMISDMVSNWVLMNSYLEVHALKVQIIR